MALRGESPPEKKVERQLGLKVFCPPGKGVENRKPGEHKKGEGG